jgi:hypothetical protein
VDDGIVYVGTKGLYSIALKDLLLKSQTINFLKLSSFLVTDSPITLSASSTSGLPVSFSSSDTTIMSILGNKATLLKAGQVTITAFQEGNTYYSSASDVSQTICINPPKPNITISQATTTSPLLTSSSSSGNQWFLNGSPVSDSTSVTLSVTNPGEYTVQVTVDICPSQMSDPIGVITGDIKTVTSQEIMIYPNPARASIYVGLENLPSGNVTVIVTDLLGYKLGSYLTEGGTNYPIEVSSYYDGYYMLRVEQHGKVYYNKFIVNK